jgi:hypothetical protein
MPRRPLVRLRSNHGYGPLSPATKMSVFSLSDEIKRDPRHDLGPGGGPREQPPER